MKTLDIIIIIFIISFVIIYYKIIYPISNNYFEKSLEKYILFKANPLFDASSAHIAIIAITIISFISIVNYFFR